MQGRARQLYKAGYKTLQHVASADPESLVRNIDHMPRKAAKQIVTSAQVSKGLSPRVEQCWSRPNFQAPNQALGQVGPRAWLSCLRPRSETYHGHLRVLFFADACAMLTAQPKGLGVGSSSWAVLKCVGPPGRRECDTISAAIL